jgi:putative membrane protein
MSKVRQLVQIVLLILIAVVVIVFTLENDQRVALIFFTWSTPQASVAVYIVLALLVGCCLGPLVGSLARLRLRRAAKARVKS